MSLRAVADEHTLVPFLRAHLVLGTLIRSVGIAVVEVGIERHVVGRLRRGVADTTRVVCKGASVWSAQKQDPPYLSH